MVKRFSAVVMAVLLLGAWVAPVAASKPLDLCPNLKGMQKEVPAGYEREIGLTGWECYPIGTR